MCVVDEPTSVRSLAATLGVDRLLLEVDYPHADSSWPATQEAVDGMLASLAPADACRVAHGSAAALFRWDLPASTPCPAGHSRYT